MQATLHSKEGAPSQAIATSKCVIGDGVPAAHEKIPDQRLNKDYQPHDLPKPAHVELSDNQGPKKVKLLFDSQRPKWAVGANVEQLSEVDDEKQAEQRVTGRNHVQRPYHYDHNKKDGKDLKCALDIEIAEIVRAPRSREEKERRDQIAGE